MRLPPACPEIPVRDLEPALAYYRDKLGFDIDWSDASLGLAGLSLDDCRLFMASADYRAWFGSQGPLVVWLNLSSRAEVDALHGRWRERGAIIAADPQSKPYKLHEFVARDLDGNLLRVFYDFGGEEREAAAG
ncbi:MAG: VOC family protein [Pseudomonadota bacterium]|nr:VOC family protein [Pseudomonadota bacterium]